MKNFTIIFTIVLSLLLAGCGKTLKKFEDVSYEFRLNNKSIAQITNDFHAAGKLPDSFHLNVLQANQLFSESLDRVDQAIAGAKVIEAQIKANTLDKKEGKVKMKAVLDYVDRLINTELFRAFLAIADAIVDLPKDILARIEPYITAIKIAFSLAKTLIADGRTELREVAYAD